MAVVLFVSLLAFLWSQEHSIPFDILQKNDKQISFSVSNLNYESKLIDNHLNELLTENPDIIVLLEFSDKYRALFNSLSSGRDNIGYKEVEGFPAGIGVISNYPIIYREIKKIAPKEAIVHFKILIESEVLSIFVIHPPSPRTFDKFKSRNDQLALIQALAEEEKSKFVILGDFNTVPWSRHFPNIRNATTCYEHLKYYGSWFPTSYKFKWFGIPIDHCIFDDRFKFIKGEVTPIEGSDHNRLIFSLGF